LDSFLDGHLLLFFAVDEKDAGDSDIKVYA
jgi:hypothetical protein